MGLLFWLVGVAQAGDVALYARAWSLVDSLYVHQGQVNAEASFHAAGQQLESQVEWLLVDAEGSTLTLRDGGSRWSAQVTLEGSSDLPSALGRLEDAVRAAGGPLDSKLDLRVEILKGMVKPLDRYSVILAGEGLDRFDERISGTLTGIGSTISRVDDRLTIKEVYPDSPAARAGLQKGDVIVMIDGVSTVGMTPSDATTRIRGQEGSTVTLQLLRSGAPLSLTITRGKVTIPNVQASMTPQGFGVLTIDHFSEQTVDFLRKGLDQLKGQGGLDKGLIIDLRGNTGGSLIQSARAADLFVQSGVLVSTLGEDGKEVSGLTPRISAVATDGDYTLPMVVLMDPSTASGSEIMAGALAELDRALLVGENSFGKGSVQKIYPLNDGIKLKMTVAEYRVSGTRRVMDVGLPPDLALERYRFSDDTIWYPAPDRRGHQLAAGTPLVQVEDPPKPSSSAGDIDPGLEVAELLLASAPVNTRSAQAAALPTLQPALQAAQEPRVKAKFAARGIDWSPGVVEGTPVLDVKVAPTAPLVAGQPGVLTFTVTNKGPALYQAALRLQSVTGPWEDDVVALGALKPGETVTRTLPATPRMASADRVDAVTVRLELPGRAPTPLLVAPLEVKGVPLPAVAVGAQLVRRQDDQLTFSLTLTNTGPTTLTEVVASLDFPEVKGITLVEEKSDPVDLGPGESKQVTMEVGATRWQESLLPLTLDVSAKGSSRIFHAGVKLPLSGEAARWEGPIVGVSAGDTTVRVPAGGGQVKLQIAVADDRALDHVVVWGGVETLDRARADPAVEYKKDKLVYEAGKREEMNLRVKVPVQVGVNHYQIIAEDLDGLRTVREVYVWGVE